MTRQATGPNDHPNCPTFLQVYKLLSVYSIIKPPKSGNCTILDSTTTKLTIKDIKDVFSKNDTSERQSKIDNLKKRLDTLVAQDIEVKMYFKPIFLVIMTILNRIQNHVLYYICGYVTRYVNIHIKCNNCQIAVLGKAKKLKKL